MIKSNEIYIEGLYENTIAYWIGNSDEIFLTELRDVQL